MNLNEIAELSWEHIFPGGKSAIQKESFMRVAYAEFAYQQLLMAWQEKASEGEFNVPSYLSTEIEKEVVNNEMDISDINVFKSLPQEVWLQNIGGIQCQCKYVKSTVNLSQLLCEDDSLPDTDKTYFVLGKKIKFPKGVHKTPLSIIYANMGENVDGEIEVDEALGSLIRDKLDAIYLGKVPPTDVTNNNNPNS